MKLSPDQKAGLYITAIVHVAVIIVLLLVRIGYEFQRENSFVLDFTQQEEQERIREERQLKETASQLLENLISASAGVPIRAIAVDRSQLKDDRGTNAEELYREAERLAQDLKNGQVRTEDPDDFVATTTPKKEDPKDEPKPYSGPSVLSWSLDGRKASHLPIPAYRCYGAGEVTVIITVNNQGTVINAKVDEGSSIGDSCLRSFAIRAARLSKFSASQTAPARQAGTITYAFIAQ